MFAPEFTPPNPAPRALSAYGFSGCCACAGDRRHCAIRLWRQAVLGSVSGNLLVLPVLVGGIRLIGVPLPR